MKFSFLKIAWEVFEKALNIAFWLFLISVLIIFSLIIKQAKLDFEKSCIFLLVLCSVYILSILTGSYLPVVG